MPRGVRQGRRGGGATQKSSCHEKEQERAGYARAREESLARRRAEERLRKEDAAGRAAYDAAVEEAQLGDAEEKRRDKTKI